MSASASIALGQLGLFDRPPVQLVPELKQPVRPARRTDSASIGGGREKPRVLHYHRDLLALLGQAPATRPAFLLEGVRVDGVELDHWLRVQLAADRRWMRVSTVCESFDLANGCTCPSEWQQPWWARTADFRNFGESFPDAPALPGITERP